MPSRCPSKDCSGGGENRQKKIKVDQFSELSDYLKKPAMDLSRCSYCGCVYETRNQRILGFLDGGVVGEGWKPITE